MKTAAIAGTLYGNEWQTIYDSGSLVADASTITISNLDGDLDKEYRLILYGVNNGGNTASFFRFNSDSGSNYGYQRIYGAGAGTAADRNTAVTAIMFGNSNTTGQVWFCEAIIYAKSGYARTVITKEVRDISGTTVGPIMVYGQVWNNTSSNITSITINSLNANTFGVGTRAILLRRADRDASTIGKMGRVNTYGKVKGCFQRIYENTLSAAATTLDIPSLEGNTDIVYGLICRFKNDYNGSSNYFIRPNNDTGANYGRQGMYGINTSAGAYQATGETELFITACDTMSSLAQSNTLIFAKSNYLRTFITQEEQTASGNTIGALALVGGVWNNTSSNIVSLRLYANQTNGLGVGTHIELWAYRP